jgi:hypothetical protein
MRLIVGDLSERYTDPSYPTSNVKNAASELVLTATDFK